MAIGKKLTTLTCYACAVIALLLVCIAAPAIFYLASSGKPLCVPGMSIRCHESDCGSLFQRCGSNALLEVPAHKVCYLGALVSASRTELHSCPSTIIGSNSSRLQDQRSGFRACNCDTCTWPDSCRCKACRIGGHPVQCGGKVYDSEDLAECCLQERYSSGMCSKVSKPQMWKIASETVQRFFTELFIGQWSLQDFAADLAASFTFQPPYSNGCGCRTCGPRCG